MSLWLSLFGGMALTALLYGAGRRLRLSNFWASVLACGVPTLAYVMYAVAIWPGLDVVTLHVVAYPTVAVLLYQLYGAKASHAQSMHWAPKLMIGFFLGLTAVFGTLIYIAGEGLPPALAQILLPNAKGKNLYQFWGTQISDYLNRRLRDQATPVLVNLASREYFKAVDLKALKARVVECVFEEYRGGTQYKVLALHAKRARGLMARYAAQHALTFPEQLAAFNLEGYAFAPTSSSPQRMVFRRKTS